MEAFSPIIVKFFTSWQTTLSLQSKSAQCGKKFKLNDFSAKLNEKGHEAFFQALSSKSFD